jgi:hypothetical protein
MHQSPSRTIGLTAKSLVILALAFGLTLAHARAGVFDFLFPKQSSQSTNVLAAVARAGLTSDQITQGLKEALAKGVKYSITNLGREGGYLNNLKVRIPMPDRLVGVERALRVIKQDQLADGFIATMNHAAERAVPEAAGILSDAILNLTMDDAKSLLAGPNDAATQYFKKTSKSRLHDKMLPIVKKATDEVGAIASYKKLVDKAAFAAPLFKVDKNPLDLDNYVTNKALDGLFTMIAEEEQRLRENPAARTTELLKKVFDSLKP